jgi:hypothetical protein
VAFCEVLAVLIGNQGVWPALAAATASAVALQTATMIRTPILQRAVQ